MTFPGIYIGKKYNQKTDGVNSRLYVKINIE